MNQSPSGSSTGLDPKVSALLAYLFWIVGGIIFYAISKDSYVKFHAMQSILLGVTIIIISTIMWFIPFSYLFFSWILNLVYLAVYIFMGVKAYGGEKYKLPVIGDMAEKYAK